MTMKVLELVKLLQQLPDDANVVMLLQDQDASIPDEELPMYRVISGTVEEEEDGERYLILKSGEF